MTDVILAAWLFFYTAAPLIVMRPFRKGGINDTPSAVVTRPEPPGRTWPNSRPSSHW